MSWPPVEYLFAQTLEGWYPQQTFQGPDAEAIVVLSAGMEGAQVERPFPLPDAVTFERTQLAAWLHTHWKPLPVLASGGHNEKGLPLFPLMRESLLRAGVPETMIWTEERSQNTHENAAYSSRLLKERGINRIVLVVEARSMLRAEGCFRKEGMIVVPAPSSSRKDRSLAQELLPSWKAIRDNETTLHELVGLGWYWLRGWI